MERHHIQGYRLLEKIASIFGPPCTDVSVVAHNRATYHVVSSTALQTTRV